MEALSRLVTESLVRHGFDRPLDYRRLHWSRWFRCESHHSLLFVPSKPGVFAVAEEIMDFGPPTHVATAAKPALSGVEGSGPAKEASGQSKSGALAPRQPNPETAASAAAPRRLLAVTQFFEDDDMAFVLDRMLSTQNPMRARLVSGRYFVRFVVIEDPIQRRSICSALNQWMVSSAEKASGIGSHFASSLELTPATEYVPASDDARQTCSKMKMKAMWGGHSCPPLSAQPIPMWRQAPQSRSNRASWQESEGNDTLWQTVASGRPAPHKNVPRL